MYQVGEGGFLFSDELMSRNQSTTGGEDFFRTKVWSFSNRNQRWGLWLQLPTFVLLFRLIFFAKLFAENLTN